VIVGFDPGTTSALAVLDFRKNPVLVKSFKGGLMEAVKLLRGFKPSIVASDRHDSESVRRLASAFGAVAFFPKKDLTVREKSALVRGYHPGNSHERDALAAALNAYKHYGKLIKKLFDREREIFLKLVKEELANLSGALKLPEGSPPPRRKRDFALESRVRDLERKLEVAEHLLAEREREVKRLKGEKRTVLKPIPVGAEEERAARERLELELLEAHARIGRIEAELKRLKKAEAPVKEDIRQRIIRMMEEYKKRFRK